MLNNLSWVLHASPSTNLLQDYLQLLSASTDTLGPSTGSLARSAHFHGPRTDLNAPAMVDLPAPLELELTTNPRSQNSCLQMTCP